MWQKLGWATCGGGSGLKFFKAIQHALIFPPELAEDRAPKDRSRKKCRTRTALQWTTPKQNAVFDFLLF